MNRRGPRAIVTMLMTAATLAANALAQEPATLRNVMTELGAVYLRLSDAVMRGDTATAREAAEEIVHHPMPAAVVGTVKATLGGAFAEFDAIDAASHEAAEALAKAAIASDAATIGAAYARLGERCTACHVAFRERLRPLSGAVR